MEVKCTIRDYLAEKLGQKKDVVLESVAGHGDQVRITTENGVTCVVGIDELISAANRCKLNCL